MTELLLGILLRQFRCQRELCNKIQHKLEHTPSQRSTIMTLPVDNCSCTATTTLRRGSESLECAGRSPENRIDKSLRLAFVDPSLIGHRLHVAKSSNITQASEYTQCASLAVLAASRIHAIAFLVVTTARYPLALAEMTCGIGMSYRHEYRHENRHVYRHVCRHVCRHVYRHVCRDVCTHALCECHLVMKRSRRDGYRMKR